MPSSPLEDVAKGAAEGTTNAIIEHTPDWIHKVSIRLRDKEVAFIRDNELIEAIIKEKKTGEWNMINQFLLPQTEYAIPIRIGLTLRDITGKETKQRIRYLRTSLREEYGKDGLHIAELTENGLVTEYLVYILRQGVQVQEAMNSFNRFLELSEDVTIFVETTSGIKSTVSLIKTRLDSSGGLHTVIVIGRGSCKPKVSKIVEEIGDDPRKYVMIRRETTDLLTVFIMTPEIAKNIDHWSDTFDV